MSESKQLIQLIRWTVTQKNMLQVESAQASNQCRSRKDLFFVEEMKNGSQKKETKG